eukprot:gene2312-5297_t
MECGGMKKKTIAFIIAICVLFSEDRHQRAQTIVSHHSLPSLSRLPFDLQEQAVLNDLLYVLLDVPGTYISARRDETTRAIRLIPPTGIDPQLKRMVERVLPCCSDYTTIARYISVITENSTSRVNQALAEALQDIIKDYSILIAQLEHQLYAGQLTLQKLIYCLQPTHFVMEKISLICQELMKNSLCGGASLSILHRAAQGSIGQGKLHELCCFLAEKASQPYLEMLATWIYDGILSDPGREFMVQQTNFKSVITDPLEMNCCLVAENIPSFLQDVAENILQTGRYLRALAQCDCSVDATDCRDINYSLQQHKYYDVVQSAHERATRSLLQTLRRDYKLSQILSSVKSYFFMEQGDLFIHFLNTAEGLTNPTVDELNAPHQLVNVDRLSSLLDYSLRTSSSRADPFKDNLGRVTHELSNIIRISKTQMTDLTSENEFVDLPRDLPILEGVPTKELTGFDLFTLTYSVQWPISLILDYHALRRYQFLFRFIFEIKDVEQQLVTSVIASAAVRRSRLPWMQRAFALRQRMLTFVQTLEHYVVFVVVEPYWNAMKKSVHQVMAINELLASHNDFLDTLLRKCMLTNEKLLKTISGLLRLCKVFALYMKRFVKTADKQLRVKAPDVAYQSSQKTVWESTTKAEATFYAQMGAFVLHLTEVATLENEQDLAKLVLTLNYNGFYNKQVKDAEFQHRMHHPSPIV